ncbi:MAG: type II CAAX prenyl endopeptidase Rce1 family protein [Ruminococcus sp.]
MNKTDNRNSETQKPDTVDVVAESNYGTVSEEYNQLFRAWRNDATNEYAFRCRKREKEVVYVEGKGYHDVDPAVEERNTMLRINVVLGMAMLYYLLVENLLTAVLMGVAQLMGLDVGYCYSDGTVYGNQTAVLIILMLKTLLKYLVPILIFHFSFRMPCRMAYRVKPDAPREIPASIAVTLVVFAVTNIWLLFSSANLLSFSTLGDAYYTVSYMHPAYQAIYLIFELFMVSILKEVMFHGEMLHVLRQFGDWYAVILTAVLTACATHSHVTLLMELTMSIVTGIAVLRSGSLLPGILDQLIYHVLLFTFFYLEISPNRILHTYRPLLMFAVLLAGVILCLTAIRPTKKSPALLPQKHYLSSRERVQTLLHFGPLTIIFCLCVVLMVIEVVF